MHKKRLYDNYPIIFSGMLTAFVLLAVFALKGCFVFGDASLAASDALLQYLPLFGELRDRIFEGGFLYSWANGLGSSFFISGVYYFFSPLTFLAVLIPGLNIFDTFDLAVLLKACAAACAFSYYIQKSLGGKSLMIMAFSISYALCGFFTAYSFNILWFDALVFLPLIALGIEKIVGEKSGVLYCCALGLAIMTSFYTGFMLCIFSVLYFLVRIFGSEGLTSSHNKVESSKLEVESEEQEDEVACCKLQVASDGRGEAPRPNAAEETSGEEYEGRALLPILLKFGGYSLLAGALAAVTLLPLYRALGNSFIKFAQQDTFLFGISDFLTGHLLGTNSVKDYGITEIPHPFFYSGITALLLAPLFIFIKKIKLSERIAYSLLALLLILSLLFSKINLIWHGISIPAGFPYRFVFLYTFVILVIAYRVFLNIDSVKGWLIAAPGVLCAAVCAVLTLSANEYYDMKKALINIAFATLLCGVLLAYKYLKGKRTVIIAAAVLLIVSEIIFNTTMSIGITRADEAITILRQKESVRLAVASLEDGTLHRSQSVGGVFEDGLAGSLYGYNGISTFSSLSDEILTGSVGGLGILHNYQNAFTYKRQTPVFNSFFAIKYLYDLGDGAVDEEYYTPLGSYNGEKDEQKHSVKAYEYKYPLPVAFAVNKTVTDWLGSFLSDFLSQNALFENSCGVKNVFQIVNSQDYTATDAKIYSMPEMIKSGAVPDPTKESFTKEQLDEYMNGLYQVTLESPDMAEAVLTYTVLTDEPLYFFYSSDIFNSLTVSFNAHEETYIFKNGFRPYIIPVEGAKKGDTLTFTAKFSEYSKKAYLEGGYEDITKAFIWLKLYSFDEEKFQNGYEYLKEGALDITEFKDTYIKGTLTAKEEQMIFTSIPYSEGWSAYIDGEQTEVICPEDTHLILLDVEAGAHTLELKYEVPGLKYGLAVSAGALVLFLCAAFVGSRRAKS